MGSLIEEVLAPVDRDEFQREITYFRDLTSQSVPMQSITPSSSPGATQP
jgi:phospholipid N-methyltransferase